MNLSFQPITSADEAFLLSLYASVRAAEMALVPWTGEQKAAFLKSQFDAQYQYYAHKYPHGAFLTIALDGEKIGRLYTAELADEVRIIELTLAPEARGRGLGTRIVSDIVGAASKPVRIYLERDDRAAPLFARLGFGMIRDEGLYQLWEGPAANRKNLNATAT